MKRNLITLFLIAAFCYTASAQHYYGPSSSNAGNTIFEKGDFEFGIGAGYGLSYIDYGNSYSSIIGAFNASVSADYYFSENWGLKIKVIYDQKGSNDGSLYDNNGNEIDGLKARFNYITVPLMASWHFGINQNWYQNFGLYVGFLNNVKIGGYNVNGDFNTVDGGLSEITGVKFPLSNRTSLFIELEVQQGVVNVAKYDNYDSQSWIDRGSFNVGINF